MQIRQITPTYHVAPQIDPADLAAIKDAGFTTVICNRPDEEIPPSHQATAMSIAAEAAGLKFEVLPLTRDTLMQPDNIARQSDLSQNSEGKVLAYCASGTRSTMIWALGQTQAMSPDEILQTTAQGGYDLEMIRPLLNKLSGL